MFNLPNQVHFKIQTNDSCQTKIPESKNCLLIQTSQVLKVLM